jgi:hypothetical protein
MGASAGTTSEGCTIGSDISPEGDHFASGNELKTKSQGANRIEKRSEPPNNFDLN